jgi:hypothetical protein
MAFGDSSGILSSNMIENGSSPMVNLDSRIPRPFVLL